MQALEVSGQWWLPGGSEDRRVGGTLKVSENGHGELVLTGALSSHLEGGEPSRLGDDRAVTTFSKESIARTGLYSRIHGVAENEVFTLGDCITTRRTNIFDHMEAQHVYVNQVFRGVLLNEKEAPEFTKAFVGLDWLAYWVRKSGFSESYSIEPDMETDGRWRAMSLTLSVLDAETFLGPRSASYTLGQEYGVQGDGILERRLWQDFYFGVDYGALTPLEQIVDDVSDLQDLVTMGTGRIASFKNFSLRHPDVSFRIGEKEHQSPIDYFAHWHASRVEPIQPLSESDMLFTFDDLGGTRGMEKWLKVAAVHRSALGRVMATRYGQSMFVSDRLLNCAAALEAFDRDKHGDGDQIEYLHRIKRCVSLAGEPFEKLVGDTDAWATAFKNERNTVAHHKPRIIASSTEQHILGETAYWLFIFCMLQEAGIEAAAFVRMMHHRQYRWLKGRVREVLSQDR